MDSIIEEKIARNSGKIAGWNGETIADLTDAVDVLKLYNVVFDYSTEEKKPIPKQFKDVDSENVYAIDEKGCILYTNGSITSVEKVRQRKEREQKGLAPFDDVMDKIKEMQENYSTWKADEEKKMEEKGRVRSTLLNQYNEALTILDKIGDALSDAIKTVEG